MAPLSEVVTARPAPAVAGFVDHYLGYRMTGYAPGLHRGLPARHLTFIVSIGPGIDVHAQTDPAQRPDSYRCVLGGLQARPATIAHTGHQEGVAVALTPPGCRALLGLPAAGLWDTSVEFARVSPLGDELWERLQGPASWPSRFAVCDEILARLADPDRTVSAELDWAWRTLVAGNTPIGTLAREVGWSRQYLTRRFAAEFGPGPKLAARIARFERARRLIGHTPPTVDLAGIAAICGYYDQSHLNRDFAELAGCSPTTWLAEEIPSVQDTGAPPG